MDVHAHLRRVPAHPRSRYRTGYFDAVSVSHDFGGGFSASYDFEPRVQNGTVVWYSVQAGMPGTETISGVAVRPADAVDLSSPAVVFGELIALEDIDAYDERPNGNVVFSTSTSVFLDGNQFAAGDLVECDGSSYSLFFDYP
jgi:hypothetical protein